MTRFVGSTQSKWNIKEGKVIFAKDEEGNMKMTTEGLVIVKGDVQEQVDYVCNSAIHVSDFQFAAPGQLDLEDDIVDMPFPDVSCAYYGDLYGSETGNFVINMFTKGLSEDETGKLPGIYLTLNFFTKLFAESDDPELPEGIYTVSTSTSNSLFQAWSILPGLTYEDSPFGSYVVQQLATGTGAYEFVSSGTIKVSYEAKTKIPSGHDILVLEYDLKTSSRSIKGIWKGECYVENEAGTSSAESFLTTLTDDVTCDLAKVTEGHLRHVETLRRKLTNQVLNEQTGKYEDVDEGYDIADAWRLILEPRDWTEAEYDIPWVDSETGKPYDRGDLGGIAGNGIHDRLDVWCADGDAMYLEFVLPLEGVKDHASAIAKEIGVEYTYILQPQLDQNDETYEAYVSDMGRPDDEIFDANLVQKTPDWAGSDVIFGYQEWVKYLGISNFDLCARRGFTWSTDGFRGNWYFKWEKGRHQILEGHAPAVNGWVKVKRTAEDVYTFEWEFTDDYPKNPNTIKGKIENCVVTIHPKPEN